jgi:hypothetical protein
VGARDLGGIGLVWCLRSGLNMHLERPRGRGTLGDGWFGLVELFAADYAYADFFAFPFGIFLAGFFCLHASLKGFG